MIPEFLEEGPALVIESEEKEGLRILAVADTHFGAESFLARHGLHIESNSTERLNRLKNCIRDSGCDMLIFLGDVKHSIPVSTWQEKYEMPKIFSELRKIVKFRVIPGNHDGGIDKYLNPDELLSNDGTVIDGIGYIHGHTYPSPKLLGKLIICGHTHPVVCLYDEVGCSLKSQPAYLLSGIDKKTFLSKAPYTDEEMDGIDVGKTRVLFVPAFFELAGGIDVREIMSSSMGPLSRSIDPNNAEVFLSDGTYINTLANLNNECTRPFR